MKIFVSGESYHSKNNFVDENNVFLGYDEEDDCCSDGGWFISDKSDEWLKETFKEEAMDFPGWTFDTTYFKCPAPNTPNEEYSESYAAQFRIVNGDNEKFITLYNCHNGYYSKGFEFKVGDKVVQEDSL